MECGRKTIVFFFLTICFFGITSTECFYRFHLVFIKSSFKFDCPRGLEDIYEAKTRTSPPGNSAQLSFRVFASLEVRYCREVPSATTERSPNVGDSIGRPFLNAYEAKTCKDPQMIGKDERKDAKKIYI